MHGRSGWPATGDVYDGVLLGILCLQRNGVPYDLLGDTVTAEETVSAVTAVGMLTITDVAALRGCPADDVLTAARDVALSPAWSNSPEEAANAMWGLGLLEMSLNNPVRFAELQAVDTDFRSYTIRTAVEVLISLACNARNITAESLFAHYRQQILLDMGQKAA
jgi:hypothetical protein